MEKLLRIQSPAVPIMNANVDTDIITPMKRITSRNDNPLAHYAFEPLRYLQGDGDLDKPNPDFPLNDPKYDTARIMICGENFGCGSSRESAPAAIAELGFRCLIGSSFGDIFFNNCFQQGILPIMLDVTTVDTLAHLAESGVALTVDLPGQTITTPDQKTMAFEVNPLKKRALMEGLDDMSLTLKENDKIAAWQASDRQDRPWIYDIERS